MSKNNREVISFGHFEHRKDGDRFVRAPRYVWLVKYDEKTNKVSFEEYGEAHIEEGKEDKTWFYQANWPFFMDGCICAYCVAENEHTAFTRVYNMIAGADRTKHMFLKEFGHFRIQDGVDEEIWGQPEFDENGRVVRMGYTDKEFEMFGLGEKKEDKGVM